MGKTEISWTDYSWNIARGCSKVDSDCKNCYMMRDSMDGTRYNPTGVVRTKSVFNLPMRIKEPSRIFTCSLTDFFHQEIDSYRHEAWDIIRKCPQHTFQILTKRPERVLANLPPDWNEGWDNVWLGTSVGHSKSIHRIIQLLELPAKLRFVSLEPLHGPIDLCNVPLDSTHLLMSYEVNVLTGVAKTTIGGSASLLSEIDKLDWVIVGGESGNDNGKWKYRPCELEWIEKIVNDCLQADVPVFVKQMGTHLSKKFGMKRHGAEFDEFHTSVMFQQFPKNVKA